MHKYYHPDWHQSKSTLRLTRTCIPLGSLCQLQCFHEGLGSRALTLLWTKVALKDTWKYFLQRGVVHVRSTTNIRKKRIACQTPSIMQPHSPDRTSAHVSQQYIEATQTKKSSCMSQLANDGQRLRFSDTQHNNEKQLFPSMRRRIYSTEQLHDVCYTAKAMEKEKTAARFASRTTHRSSAQRRNTNWRAFSLETKSAKLRLYLICGS